MGSSVYPAFCEACGRSARDRQPLSGLGRREAVLRGPDWDQVLR